MEHPFENLLHEYTEYAIICDICDEESTRDGNSYLAARKAEAEGFKARGFSTYCPGCYANEERILSQ